MKKLIDFIFETEEIVEEEVKTPVEPAPIKETPKVEVKPVQKKETIFVDEVKPNDALVNEKREAVRRNDVLNKTKPEFAIDIDSYPTKKTQKVVVKKQDKNDHYVAKPPMSPIFGVLENKKDPRIIVAPTTVKQVNSLNSSKIGTVLSPIYGVITNNENTFKDEVIPIKVKEEVKEEVKKEKEVEQLSFIEEVDIPKPQAKKDNYFDEYFSNTNKDNSFDNGSIDDILIKPKDETYIMNQDISLFEDEME